MNRHFLDFHSLQPTSCVEKVRSQILSLRQPDWGCSTSSTPRAQNPADFCRCFYSGELSGRLELLSTGAGECIFLRGLRTSSWSPVPNLLEANAASGQLISNPSPSTEKNRSRILRSPNGICQFDTCRPSQPFRRSARLPKKRENGPEIPAFRVFDFVSVGSRVADLEVEIAESLRPCPRIFPFWETIGGDWFDHDCRLTLALCVRP